MTSPPGPERERNTRRLDYVDALRVGVIGLVFVVHVCEIFNPWDQWHITNADTSRVAGEIVVIAAPWIMPLIMLLAGINAWFSLQHRTNADYVRERVLRLLLPLAAGVLLLVPPQVYLERLARGQFHGSYIDFYPHFFDGIYPQGNLSWHHLWFLAHLFAYSLLALPLFRYWQRTGGRKTMHIAARLCGAPGGILWLSIPLIVERSTLWGFFPERHMLTADWSNHALLFVAYVYGFVLAGSPWLAGVIDSQWRRAFLVGALGSIALVVGTWRGAIPNRLPPPYSISYLAFWTMYAVCAWGWMVGMLGLGRRWLDREGPVVAYGRRVGYILYVVHQPIIVAVAFIVVRWSYSVPAKLSMIFVFSLVLSVGATEVLCRLLMLPELVRRRRRRPRLIANLR